MQHIKLTVLSASHDDETEYCLYRRPSVCVYVRTITERLTIRTSTDQ